MTFNSCSAVCAKENSSLKSTTAQCTCPGTVHHASPNHLSLFQRLPETRLAITQEKLRQTEGLEEAQRNCT